MRLSISDRLTKIVISGGSDSVNAEIADNIFAALRAKGMAAVIEENEIVGNVYRVFSDPHLAVIYLKPAVDDPVPSLD